jgi:hypothetical protein
MDVRILLSINYSINYSIINSYYYNYSSINSLIVSTLFLEFIFLHGCTQIFPNKFLRERRKDALHTLKFQWLQI